MVLPRYLKITIAAAALVTFGAIYTKEAFLTFLIGWVVLIPIVACGFLLYGLIEYRKQTKNSIIVSVKPNNITQRYADLLIREDKIKKEKESLCEELKKNNKVR